MRTLIISSVLVLNGLLLVAPPVLLAQDPRREFTDGEVQALIRENLDPEIEKAHYWAGTDHRRVSAIRLSQFGLTSLATILAAVVAAGIKTAGRPIAAATAVCAGLATALSGLPAAGFDFDDTYRAQQNKANALGELKLMLQYEAPDRSEFLRLLTCVNQWTDRTDSSTTLDSCARSSSRTR